MPTDRDLFAAIRSMELDAVRRVMESEGGISYAHAYDYTTPLLQATELGSFEIVRYLLERKRYDIDEGHESTGFSPLLAACRDGHAEIAKMLLEHGADADRQYEEDNEQGNCLTLAIENGHISIVKMLLAFGARTDGEKWSCSGSWNSRKSMVFLALEENNTEILEWLLTHGTDVDAECLVSGEVHTPLSYAVAKQKLDWISLLLKHGASLERMVEDGLTVFEYAESLGRLNLLSPENRRA